MVYEVTNGFGSDFWGVGPLPEEDELKLGLVMLFKF